MEVGNLDEYAKANQLKQIMNDFLSNLLLHKPDDAYQFSRQYFSTFHSTNPVIQQETRNADMKESSQGQYAPIVFAGPSGVGKGTLIGMLLVEFPDKFGFSVSHTTRQPRSGETNGVQYWFVGLEAMQKEVDAGKFIEHANVHGNIYGTSKLAVESVTKQNKICILDIDVQGCEQVKRSSIDARYLMVVPPTFADLEKRLRLRKTETEATITRRLKNAATELAYRDKPGFFDKIIVNDDVKVAYEELKAWVFNSKK